MTFPAEEMERARKGRGESTPQAPPALSPLAEALRDYLEANPHDADQLPGWLAGTLWALELVDGKPSRDEVQAAIDALGGDDYRLKTMHRERSTA